jgi:hypothetical protein
VVTEVPVTLTVTVGTDAEGAPGAAEGPALSVYPNPSAGRSTVALALTEAADVRVAVYDVLGRQVAVVHEGPLAVGAHRFTLDAGALPAGVYVVRSTGGEFAATQRMTVLR